jgi:hypothetical protein
MLNCKFFHDFETENLISKVLKMVRAVLKGLAENASQQCFWEWWKN